MSLERFHEICCKLEGDEQNKNLEYAIQSWCKELNFNENAIMQYIHQWQEDLSDQTLEKLPFFNVLIKPTQSVINLGIKKMKINDIVLIAFVLTGVGVGLYLLDQNQKKSKRDRTSRHQPNSGRTSPPELTGQSQPNILILVINAENNERIIDTLKREDKVTSENWENLYNLMEALWMGEERNFKGTDLESKFLPNETSEPSEYDIYFIKIELRENIQGFEKNRNSLERFDAFEALSKKEHEVIDISPRLSIQSTNNRILYR